MRLRWPELACLPSGGHSTADRSPRSHTSTRGAPARHLRQGVLCAAPRPPAHRAPAV